MQKSLTGHKFHVNVSRVTDKLFRNKSLILLFPVAPEFHKVRVSKLSRSFLTTQADYSMTVQSWHLSYQGGRRTKTSVTLQI